MKLRSGLSQVELLLYAAGVAILMVAVLPAYMALSNISDNSSGDPGNEFELRQVASSVADNLRMADVCDTTAGCPGTAFSAFSVADVNRVVFYTSSSGTTREYKTTAGVGVQQVIGGVTKTILANGSISFKYVYDVGGAFNLAAEPAVADWVNTVATGNIAKIAAVKVSLTRTVGRRTYTQDAWVRLRNSPVQ